MQTTGFTLLSRGLTGPCDARRFHIAGARGLSTTTISKNLANNGDLVKACSTTLNNKARDVVIEHGD